MVKKIISTDKAPKPRGPYSQAIVAGDMIFVAGMLGIVPASGEFVSGGFREQAHQALDNLRAALEGAGATLADVVKVTVFLRSASNYKEMNEIYASYFMAEQPTRTTVEVKMMSDLALIEVDAVAFKPR